MLQQVNTSGRGTRNPHTIQSPDLRVRANSILFPSPSATTVIKIVRYGQFLSRWWQRHIIVN